MVKIFTHHVINMYCLLFQSKIGKINLFDRIHLSKLAAHESYGELWAELTGI